MWWVLPRALSPESSGQTMPRRPKTLEEKAELARSLDSGWMDQMNGLRVEFGSGIYVVLLFLFVLPQPASTSHTAWGLAAPDSRRKLLFLFISAWSKGTDERCRGLPRAQCSAGTRQNSSGGRKHLQSLACAVEDNVPRTQNTGLCRKNTLLCLCLC